MKGLGVASREGALRCVAKDGAGSSDFRWRGMKWRHEASLPKFLGILRSIPDEKVKPRKNDFHD